MQTIFILVDSEEEQNIGSAARAMYTMGYQELRLVRPKAHHLSGLAKALAHGSQQVLEAAQVYDTLSDALGDVDLACATTARHRLVKHHYFSVRELPELLKEKGDTLHRMALVFGGERAGLTRHDIEVCDLVATIPQAVLSPSLNLAQAVMIYGFVLSDDQTQVQIKDQRLNSQQMPPEQYASLKGSCLRLLNRLGLADRYTSYIIKGLARLGREDLYLLHNIRSLIDRKLDQLEARPSDDSLT